MQLSWEIQRKKKHTAANHLQAAAGYYIKTKTLIFTTSLNGIANKNATEQNRRTAFDLIQCNT